MNIDPNNGGVPNLVVNNNGTNQLNNANLSKIVLPNWCRLHSPASHGKASYS